MNSWRADLLNSATDIESVAQTGNWRRLTKVLLKRSEFTPEIAAKSAHLFRVRSITGAYLQPGFVDCNGKGVYRGANPPEGALLSFWIKEGGPEPVKLEIKNAQGQTVANLTAPAMTGINRASWDLKPTKDVMTEYGGEGSLFVRAGTYEVTLTYGKETSKQKFDVAIAPGIETR